MKTLIDTPLFNLFAAYTNGTERAAGELSAAYEDFGNLLAELPQDEDPMRRLRRLNYTRIELAFMQRICNGMPRAAAHIIRCIHRQDAGTAGCGSGNDKGFVQAWRFVVRIEDGNGAGKQWKKSRRYADLERYGQRPDRTGGGTDGCRSDRDGGRQGAESGGCYPGI